MCQFAGMSSYTRGDDVQNWYHWGISSPGSLVLVFVWLAIMLRNGERGRNQFWGPKVARSQGLERPACCVHMPWVDCWSLGHSSNSYTTCRGMSYPTMTCFGMFLARMCFRVHSSFCCFKYHSLDNHTYINRYVYIYIYIIISSTFFG